MKQSTIKIVLLFTLIHTSFIGFSQQTFSIKDVFSIDGYVKYMPSIYFTSGNDIIGQNFIHNRINTNFYFNNNWSAKFDVRNRIFLGETVKLNPNFSNGLDADTGLVDLSWTWLNKNAIVGHTSIDRFYADYQGKKWEMRIGRQRINWGINLAWNSNDLFNTYNLIDFDYQERPGTDAIRIQYYTSDFSHIELAYSPGKTLNQSIMAGLFKFNKWKYDFQFIAGNYLSDVTFGLGWAGNIKNAGFKGEATYFHNRTYFLDTIGTLSLSTTLDFSFKNGVYINGSFLYNGLGQNDLSSLTNGQFFSGRLSPKFLMPTQYSYLFQLMGSFNPALRGGMVMIYGQGMNLLFIMPSIDYDIKNNWSLSLIGQVSFAEFQNKFSNITNALFLRLWYSF